MFCVLFFTFTWTNDNIHRERALKVNPKKINVPLEKRADDLQIHERRNLNGLSVSEDGLMSLMTKETPIVGCLGGSVG